MKRKQRSVVFDDKGHAFALNRAAKRFFKATSSDTTFTTVEIGQLRVGKVPKTGEKVYLMVTADGPVEFEPPYVPAAPLYNKYPRKYGAREAHRLIEHAPRELRMEGGRRVWI